MEKWQAKLNMQETVVFKAVQTLAEELNLLPLTAALLTERGFDTPEKARTFIGMDGHFCDPFMLPDMEKAVDRVCRAIESKEKVLIYGDYDVDGVTSTALLMLYFRSKGLDPAHYIPNRAEEGYGMNCEVLDMIARQGCTLIVTVDTGVTALEEATYCKTLGIDLVITDHHECREVLPDAIAVVDPRRPDNEYPCPNLAGVGVAFKLAAACEIRLGGEGTEDPYLPSACEDYVDLAALGTVADVMPLIGENRLIVQRGLRRMSEHPRPAIRALLEAAAEEKGGTPAEPSAATIGFTMAPRINAAGRMAHADHALELFLAEQGIGKANIKKLAERLCDLNRQRQAEENRLLELAEKQLALRSPDEPAILLWGDNYCGGIIGIVAARIAERYHKPTFLISFEGDMGKGSGRSASGINLVKLLEGSADLLVKYGGHAQAAGLTIERSNLQAFYARFNELTSQAADIEAPPCFYDAEVQAEALTLRQAQELCLLEPYGEGNSQPLFCVKRMTVEQVLSMGERHTKLICSGGGISHQVLMFGQPRNGLDLFEGDQVDLLVELSLNHFRGTTSVQLICRSWRHSQAFWQEDEALFCRSLLPPHSLLTDRAVDWSKGLMRTDIPCREDCGALYLYLRKMIGFERRKLTSLRKLTEATEGRMSSVKVTLSLRLLSDAGLLCITASDPLILLLPKTEGKIDLTALPLYKFLHSPSVCEKADS